MPCRCPPKSKEAGRASNSVDIYSVAAKQTAAVRTRKPSLSVTSRLCLTLGRAFATKLPKSEKFDEDRKMRSATLDIFLASDHQVSGETMACETTAPFTVENHTEKVSCIHDPSLQTRLLNSNPYLSWIQASSKDIIA